MTSLHEGSDVATIRKQFADLIRGVSPQEIAEIEQTLIAEGVPVEQVQKLCDVHVAVFEDTLKSRKKVKAIPGHPVHTYLQENKVARQILRRLKRLTKRVPKGHDHEAFAQELQKLRQINVHFQRKENQLFPLLERVGFTGPSKVMWGKHDEIRAQLGQLDAAYQTSDWPALRITARTVSRSIRRMLFMEERILFPNALSKIADKQWAEVREGEPEIGYAWIQPGNLWDSSLVRARETSAAPETGAGEVSTGTPPSVANQTPIALDVGELSQQQINLMLNSLPLDISFVDENDRVRYYSQSKERIFPRSPAVIGREVQNCHPPQSVQTVEKILKCFRQKTQNKAEFWITVEDRFIHIRYFAVYDAEGEYRGVVEVSQDVTDIRALQGQKRLLDW